MGRMKDRAIQQLNGGSDMKVVLSQTMCGPEGNGFKGTVLDIPTGKTQTVEVDGKETKVPYTDYLIQNKFAVPFDQSIHGKLKNHGLVKAER